MNLVPAALRGTAFAAVTTLALATPAAVAYAAVPAAVAPPAALPATAVPAAAAPALVVHAAAPVTKAAPAAVRPELPAAAPIGPLQSDACVNAVCDLWAKAGTLTVSSTSIPIWGFASTDGAAVTTPGPVLVVNEGDNVTINVHNGLPIAQNLSLAIPEMTGLASDTTGVPQGGVATYHFTAGRPGTYLYEAGHTADGGRQAAMGLVGALVVKAAASATSGGRPVAYGAGTAYDDEAVMVLTEIDPALNTSADPLAFDMRSYAPKYRLIDGRAFPETLPIATDAGRTVLLRYVNAGLQAHPMTTLGLDQQIVGQDSRPTAYPEGAVTVPLAPGRTVDALVNMPSNQDGRKFMVFESGGQLNNNGDKVPATAGVTPQQAFGGMMTYLATNPVVVNPDPTGPVTTRVVASPNPASVLAPVTVTADFTDAQPGSVIDRAEVVIDDLTIAEGTSPVQFDPTGFGGATVTGATATITPAQLQGLTQGKHTLWVRAHDAGGKWGVVSSTTINLAVTGAVTTGLTVTPNPTAGLTDLAVSATGDDSTVGGTVTGAEYFIDADATSPPANGSGQSLTLNRNGATIAAETATIPSTVAAGLAEGRHKVSVHTQDSEGLWGPFADVDVVVDRTGPTLDSGAILPTVVTASTTGAPAEDGYLRIDAAFTDPVSPPTAGVNSAITAIEGFLDTAGADGTGNAFQPTDSQFNAATESGYGLVPLTQFTQLADGPHQILVHARDAAGNWGPLTALPFTLDRGGPAVSALSGLVDGAGVALTANAADGASAVVAAEWFENADPGAGKANPMTVNPTGATTAGLSATVTGLATGDHVLWVRAKDANGNWGRAVSTVVTVNSALAIFANTFNTGDASAWSQRVRTVQVAPSTAFSNSPALTVSGRTATYVVDNRPTKESNLHVQFGFAAGTYTTKGTVVDVFQARTSSGSKVLAVQYQSTATGIPQLRVGVQTKTGWKYSAWSTIPRSAVTVKVNWTAGTSGTATLAVEGATVATATGNTSAYRVESDALGVVAVSGSASVTGSAAIDNYTSNR